MKTKPFLEKAAWNVLLTDSSPNWGGQQYRLLREAEWLSGRGHHVLVVCGNRSELAARLQKHAPHIQVSIIRSWGGPLGLLEFLWKVRRWKPDVIHTRSGQDALWACLLHFAGWTVVHSRHMTMPSHLTARRRFPYRSGCARVIASAKFIKRDLIVRAGVPESCVDVADEGVDLKEFHPGVNGRGFRAEFAIPEDAPVFGLVAMVRKEKGHNHFVNAASMVLKSFPGARFVIAGDGTGEQVEKLRRKILKEFPHAPSPVIFVGYRDDVPEIMAAIDVLVVPSLKEAQTIVIPQAFATGKPVVASDVGGIPELVKHGENGFLVRAGDERGLAEAMALLAGSPDLRSRLGDAGLELARRELAFEGKMELLLESYRKAADKRLAGSPASHEVRGYL
ncbi:MAG: glycosyltransferase family 4 protein [Verrucomicrobiae bacterium]